MLVADRQQTLEEYLLSVEARIDEVVAEILALRAENAELRAFKASVPWDALRELQQTAAHSHLASDTPLMRVGSWYIVSHPKEAASE
jgi:hypothetical protein